MFGMGWTEILLIAIVALIVVGPKELPGLFRTVGQFVGRARGMAREFSRAMEEAADQSGMKDATDAFKGIADPKRYGLDKLKDATSDMSKAWTSSGGKSAAEKARENAARARAEKAESEAAAREAESQTMGDGLTVPDVTVAPAAETVPEAVETVSAGQPRSTSASRASGHRAAAPRVNRPVGRKTTGKAKPGRRPTIRKD